MKTLKIGDTVTINKSGLFNGCIGEVLANNPDIKNSLTVILENNAGTWSFSYSDIGLPKTKDNASQPAKTSDTPKETITREEIKAIAARGLKNVITSLENETIKVEAKKLGRKPKDKTEVKVTKEKRKYNKRK